MAALGKNKQYVWNNILPRHWISTARKVGFDDKEMLGIVIECFNNVDTVITEVSKKLPRRFPKVVSESIFDGIKQLRDRHQLGVNDLLKG